LYITILYLDNVSHNLLFAVKSDNSQVTKTYI
jgi:hypothetical protein